jgi:branched-chain amino acid transport system ATP-binding protein
VSTATATTTPVVFIDNVVAGYLPGVNILNGCSLVAEQGELIGIIGPERRRQVDAPEGDLRRVNIRSGTVSLEGEDITGLRANKLVQRGVGWCRRTTTCSPRPHHRGEPADGPVPAARRLQGASRVRDEHLRGAGWRV